MNYNTTKQQKQPWLFGDTPRLEVRRRDGPRPHVWRPLHEVLGVREETAWNCFLDAWEQENTERERYGTRGSVMRRGISITAAEDKGPLALRVQTLNGQWEYFTWYCPLAMQPPLTRRDWQVMLGMPIESDDLEASV